MKLLCSAFCAALSAAGWSAPVHAAGIAGRFLVTLTGHPTSANGTQYCATLVAGGSTLGFAVSGTLTLQDAEGRSYPGTWFVDHGAASFEVPLPLFSDKPSFIVFSGVIGNHQISQTAVTEVLNGAPAFDGSFTAVRNACP